MPTNAALAKEDVERMVQDAERNSAADKEKSSQIETKNQADSLCYQTKKQLDELADKISIDEKVKIESLVTDLESAVQQENFAQMESLNEELKKAMMEIGQKVYSAGQSSENMQEAAATDDVIETDFSTEK